MRFLLLLSCVRVVVIHAIVVIAVVNVAVVDVAVVVRVPVVVDARC